MRSLDSVGLFLRLGATLLLPAAVAAAAVGCTTTDGKSNGDGVAQPDSADDGEPVGTTTLGDDTVGNPVDDGGSTTEPSATDDDAGTGPGGFIMNPDGMGVNNECDIWTQDCPDGEKCMPYANDGSGSWNATRCSEVVANPDQPGDTCTVEGGGVSGIDSCDISAMCWDVDGETNMGLCVGFCEGDANNPVCSDPDTGCSTSNDGVLILCLPFCDPLLQDCGDGGACYPEAAGFFCSPDASGADAGTYGDACEFLNVCDPGLYCADASAVPGCMAGGCCSPFCDASVATNTCPGVGQTCVAFWNEGEAPPGEEDFGLCLIEA